MRLQAQAGFIGHSPRPAVPLHAPPTPQRLRSVCLQQGGRAGSNAAARPGRAERASVLVQVRHANYVIEQWSIMDYPRKQAEYCAVIQAMAEITTTAQQRADIDDDLPRFDARPPPELRIRSRDSGR